MSLEKITEELMNMEDIFKSGLSLNYDKIKHVLTVSYSSVFGLYDIYDIHEGINQREEANHVKYDYHNKILTILVDKNYLWEYATTSSSDILRLPDEIEDVKVEFF
ncbi:MAG: hypothetical protein AABX39_06395 [Nanoarchaeota archaeon]